MEFKDRLQYLIDFYKIEQKVIVKKVGIDKAQVSNWLSGKVAKPRRKTIQNLAAYFKCNIEWLATGYGEIWPSTNPITEWHKKKSVDELDDSLPKEIQEWMNDMEKSKPGFKTWLRLEFENRFPEFEKWKATKGN